MTVKPLCSLIAALLLSACATTTGPDRSAHRHDTPIDPADMVVRPSDDWDTPPTLISGKRPIYPISKVLSREPGAAAIAFTIGIDGKARDFDVLSADDRRFADHAIIAVREWVWRPATKDGKPIEVRVSQDFQFAAP